MRFRVPADDLSEAASFYETDYKQGFTTHCPSPADLRDLLQCEFTHTEKDYTRYIEVVTAAGLNPGDRLLDFGCSWGYGSWQLAQARFSVLSHEVSRIRSTYAAQHLGCEVVEACDRIEPVKCFFSAHVIEHIPDPSVWLTWAVRILEKDGVMICFVPNGNPALEGVYGSKRYHQLWGKVHPLLWTPAALKAIATRHGFRPYVFSSPYSVDRIQRREEDDTMGEELLLLAYK